LLNWDEFFDCTLDRKSKTRSKFLIPQILTLFFAEDVRIFVDVLGNVVVARLDENLLRWELKGNFFVVRLETDSGENLGTRHEYSGEKIIEPSTPIRYVVTVIF